MAYKWNTLYLMAVSYILTGGSQISSAQNVGLCRDRTGYYYPNVFNKKTCLDCFNFLFQHDTSVRRINITAYIDNTGIDIHDTETVKIIRDVIGGANCDRWRKCCESAIECCQRQVTNQSQNYDPVTNEFLVHPENAAVKVNGEAGRCPATWDGFDCWPNTYPGVMAEDSCPSFLPGEEYSKARKYCNKDGKWLTLQGGNEWTNYTECSEDLKGFKVKLYVSIICCAISIAILVPAVIIFLSYRQLRKQHRIRLHLQLCSSFILSASITIIWEVVVVYDRMVTERISTIMYMNPAGCKILYVLTRYTRMCNYLWMFCEAFYLHRLIVNAFESPKSLRIFYVLGWGFPVLPVTIYSIVKAVTPNAQASCWIKNLGGWEWIIYVPNLVSLIANLVFLINILRILLTKLQCHPNEPSNYRRAFKATFVLVPLFGLQLFLIIYRPPPTTPGSDVYEPIAAAITYLQGFFVALVFCFLNGEVLSYLKRSCMRYAHLRRRNYGNSLSTQCTDAFVLRQDGDKAKNVIPMDKLKKNGNAVV